MVTWTETEIKLPMMLSRSKARTDGTNWQVRTQESILMPDGKLSDFIAELQDFQDSIAEAEIRFFPATDDWDAEILILGWRPLRDDEKSFRSA